MYDTTTCDRVKAALGLIPWLFPILDDEQRTLGGCHYEFAGALRSNGINLLQEKGIEAFEKVCKETFSRFSVGKVSRLEISPDSNVRKVVDYYSRSSLEAAKLYLEEVGVLEKVAVKRTTLSPSRSYE